MQIIMTETNAFIIHILILVFFDPQNYDYKPLWSFYKHQIMKEWTLVHLNGNLFGFIRNGTKPNIPSYYVPRLAVIQDIENIGYGH